MMVNRGFDCAGEDFISERWTLDKFQKVIDWGFNTIVVLFWWGKLEREDGTYQTEKIAKIKRQIALAEQVGLNVIVSLRVCWDDAGNPSWASDWSNGKPFHDYVNMTEQGRSRYAKFLAMIAQEFPNCQYCLWHFPYHRQAINDERKRLFTDVTIPSLIDAVREVNENSIIFVPIYQGATLNGETSDYYLTAEPLPYSNIIYGLGHMIPWSVVNGEWDRDEARMVRAFEGVKHWTETYGLPMLSVEYAPLSWNGIPLTESRLNCLKSSIDKMDDYQVGFLCHRISLYRRSGDNVLSDIPSFAINESISNVLKSYEVVVPPQPPTEDNRFLLLLFLSFVVFGLVLMSGYSSMERT